MLLAALMRSGKDKIVYVVAHNAEYAEQLCETIQTLTPIAPDKATRSSLVYHGTEFRFVSVSTIEHLRNTIRGPVFTDHFVTEHR